jgi:hypothetical protein
MNARTNQDEATALEGVISEAGRAAPVQTAAAQRDDAIEDLDDLLRLAPDSLARDKACAAVAADVTAFASIDDPVLRRSIAVRMGQVASVQSSYRDELAVQSAAVAKEVADAFRVFVGPDLGDEEGVIRRSKSGAELIGTILEAERGRAAGVSDVGGTIQEATVKLPAGNAVEVPDRLATLLNGRFVRNEKGEYRRKGEERLAFADEGEQIRFVDKQMDAFEAAVELAKEKGWKAIEATGTPAFRAEAWFHANLAGVEFVGYEPTDKDLKRLAEAQRFNDPLIESKQAAQKFALDQGHNVRSIGDGNQRFAGPLIHETEHHVVQDLGRQTAVVHRKKDLGAVEVGDLVTAKTTVRVQYKGGKGAVEVPARGEKVHQR